MRNPKTDHSPSDELIKSVKSWPQSGGRQRYLAYLNGADIGRSAAMEAKCAECCGGYADGRNDCRVTTCPMYPWMPYRES